MLRVISQNVNGIRGAARRGWREWALAREAQVLCVQDLRLPKEGIDECLRGIGRARGHFAGQNAHGPGVAIYAERRPRAVRHAAEALGPWLPAPLTPGVFDGYYLELDFGHCTVSSVLVPDAGRLPGTAHPLRVLFLSALRRRMNELTADGRNHLICGSWNTAHREIDLHDWRHHQHDCGFRHADRLWLSGVLDPSGGWVDLFRRLDARARQYTWWSRRGQNWVRNTGWRLDMPLGTAGLAARTRHVEIDRSGRFSEHAPVVLELAGGLS